MNLSDQKAIRDKAAAIVADWAAGREPPFTGESSQDFVEAITVAHLVVDEGRLSLHRWVDAARRSGLSWADVGGALGISKQAAQQRFRPADTDADNIDVAEGEEIVRRGATAFNEMGILRESGDRKQELVRVGLSVLVFRRSPVQWEYRRRVGAVAADEMRRAGWSYVASWLPFHYFKRPIEGC